MGDTAGTEHALWFPERPFARAGLIIIGKTRRRQQLLARLHALHLRGPSAD